jgi:hypothetical protein
VKSLSAYQAPRRAHLAKRPGLWHITSFGVLPDVG